MSFFADFALAVIPAYIDKKQNKLNEFLYPNKYYYNLWNDFLNEKNYKKAYENYNLIYCDEKSWDLCAKKYHNLGNLFFEVAMLYKNTPEKYVTHLKKALENYKKALDFRKDSQTLHNKEVVEKLLEEIESKSNSWDSSTPETPNNNKKKNWEKTDFKELEWRLEFLIKEEIRFQNKVNKQRQDSAETPFWQWFYELFSMPFPNWATKSDFTENKKDF